MKNLEELMELYRKTTQGEWRCFSGGGYVSIGVDKPSDVIEKKDGSIFSADCITARNYEFTAELHNSFPSIANEMRVMEKMVRLMAKDICELKGLPDFEVETILEFYRDKIDSDSGHICHDCGNCK